MADTGWVLPGAGANVDNGGGSWSNPGNITADDNAYAQPSAILKTTPTDDLTASAFGLSIPVGATIDGIEVRIARYAENDNVKDSSLRLVKAGSKVGDNLASASNWPSSEAQATYGSATELWGTTWTRDEVVASDFGVALSAYDAGGSNSGTNNYVDAIWVKVYYTEAAAGGTGAFFALF